MTTPDQLSADYTAQALRTESPITPALQTRLKDNARLVHAVLGLQTEAGELADPVKKHIYYGRPLDLVNLREEIGDCLWYLAIACDALGTTLEAEQARNLAKLRARYPHVFTAEAAQVRDLDREREVLEQHVADDPHTLRQQLAAAQAETVAMRKQLDEALKLIADVNTAGLQLWDKLQIANKAAAGLIVERDAARAEIESLRKQLANAQQELSEQGQAHSVELQQETADLREQLDAAQAAVTLQRAGIERQSACIGKVRAAQNNYQWPASWNKITAALAELDGEPIPVAEPATCPECELSEEMQDAVPPTWAPLVWDLRRRLREAQQARGHELERLQAFVSQVRSVVNSEWYGIEMQTVRELLAQLDAGTIKPTPVAEPIDAEGGQ